MSRQTSGDVGFREFVFRVAEDVHGVCALDDFAFVKEGGFVSDAFGLLHVMGNNDKGELTAELGDEVLNAGSGDGVQRSAGLVHEKDAWF